MTRMSKQLKQQHAKLFQIMMFSKWMIKRAKKVETTNKHDLELFQKMKNSKNKQLLWLFQINTLSNRNSHEYLIAFDSRNDRCESTAKQINDEMFLTASANWN